MSDERNQQRNRQDHRRRIRWTVAILAGLAAIIYFGFIGRGVFA